MGWGEKDEQQTSYEDPGDSGGGKLKQNISQMDSSLNYILSRNLSINIAPAICHPDYK